MTTPAASKAFTADSPFVCGWTTDSCCDALNKADDAVAQRSVNLAAEVLYALSGRQFGLCQLTVRPCRPDCCDGPCDMGGYRWTPVLSGGEWTNVSCGTCDTGCSCSKVCEVVLPGPIFDVTEVRLDGRVLAPEEYRVDDHRTLVRTGLSMLRSEDWAAEGGVFHSLNSERPAYPTTVSGAGTTLVDGLPYIPSSAGLFLVSYGLRRAQERVRFFLEPYAEVIVDNTGPFSSWEIVDTEGPSPTATAFAATLPDGRPVARGGQFGGWVIFQGRSTQAPAFEILGGTNGTGDVRGGARVDWVEYVRQSEDRECWPTCQDMNLDADQVNTWEVTYRRGLPLPEAGRAALSEFACEIAKACLGDKTCCLPTGATAVARQGINVSLVDPRTFLTDGLTGIYLVDAWLTAVNPKRRVRPAGIYSPDFPAVRHTTWPT